MPSFSNLKLQCTTPISSAIDIIVQLKAAGTCLKVYVNLKKICPSLDSLNIAGGL
jgi:hypothetical protein